MPENLVRQLRKARGWNQSDLAARVGTVTRQTIAAIEDNNWCPKLDLARAIACAFGLSIEAVFYPEDTTGDTTGDAADAVTDPALESSGASHA